MPVDAYTIGSSPAAVNLMQILQEIGDEGLQNAVTTLLHLFSRDLKSLRPIVDHWAYDRVSVIVTNDALMRVNATSWPDKVKSHAKTVLCTRRHAIASDRFYGTEEGKRKILRLFRNQWAMV